MHERITVWVGKDWDGFTFRLRPKTRQMLERRFPDVEMMPQISISFDEKKGFEAINGAIYKHVIEILTGISMDEVERIGGAKFVDAVTENTIYDTKHGK